MKRVMWRLPACSSEPTWSIGVAGSPMMRPPRRETICPSVNGPAIGFTSGSLRGQLGLEGLDHLVGDVDARAGEYGVLEDDVVLLLLRDLANDAVRLLDHLRQ